MLGSGVVLCRWYPDFLGPRVPGILRLPSAVDPGAVAPVEPMGVAAIHLGQTRKKAPERLEWFLGVCS